MYRGIAGRFGHTVRDAFTSKRKYFGCDFVFGKHLVSEEFQWKIQFNFGSARRLTWSSYGFPGSHSSASALPSLRSAPFGRIPRRAANWSRHWLLEYIFDDRVGMICGLYIRVYCSDSSHIMSEMITAGINSLVLLMEVTLGNRRD